MESLSKLDQKADWLVDRQIETNEAVRDTDLRLQKIESWKSVLSGKWAVTGVLTNTGNGATPFSATV